MSPNVTRPGPDCHLASVGGTCGAVDGGRGATGAEVAALRAGGQRRGGFRACVMTEGAMTGGRDNGDNGGVTR